MNIVAHNILLSFMYTNHVTTFNSTHRKIKAKVYTSYEVYEIGNRETKQCQSILISITLLSILLRFTWSFNDKTHVALKKCHEKNSSVV